MEMVIKHSKILTTLIIFTMLIMVFSPAAFADNGPSIEIPIRVTLSGAPPTDDGDYKVILEADNPDYPMPVGSEDGIYSMNITPEDAVKLPTIQYSSMGIYTYTIYQSGSEEMIDHDDRVYHLIVYVTEAEDGSGLETTVLLYLLGVEGKHDEVVFSNVYEEDPDPLPIEEAEPPAPETPDQPQAPQTSDDTKIWPYVGLFISGAAMIFILGMTIKKKKTDND